MNQNQITGVSPLQLIVAAMMAGLVTFGIISLFIGPIDEDLQITSILLGVLALMGMGETGAYFVLRS
ncbi:MAG TPA: hypothetical protein PL151_21450, partial [Phycisphaerae bacterium]|nr:hypothetical protein [Phycisphaerae bacterium]